MTSNATHDDDFGFIRDYQDGSKAAFASLFHKYYPMVYKIFELKGLSRPDADDLTEEIFIKLIRALKSFRFERPFEHYLRRIVRNQLIDFYRQRKKTCSFIEVQYFADKSINHIGCDELHEIIDQCLLKIYNVVRRSILLLWIEGYKRTQMADILKLPIGTIHSNLERGKVSLRKCVEDQLR